jgi:hypothetical protein
VAARFTDDALAEIKRVVETVGAVNAQKRPLRLSFTPGETEVVVEFRSDDLTRRATGS